MRTPLGDVDVVLWLELDCEGRFFEASLGLRRKGTRLGLRREGEANERLVPDPPSAVDEDDGFGFSVKVGSHFAHQAFWPNPSSPTALPQKTCIHPSQPGHRWMSLTGLLHLKHGRRDKAPLGSEGRPFETSLGLRREGEPNERLVPDSPAAIDNEDDAKAPLGSEGRPFETSLGLRRKGEASETLVPVSPAAVDAYGGGGA